MNEINLSTRDAAAARSKISAGLQRSRVLEVTHYTDKLFSFRCERPSSLRFRSGQFIMIGLEIDGRPVLRAYSIASAVYDDWLEFFSIKVPGGPLTSRLQNITEGSEVLIGGKPTGTLLADSLRPGRRLFLFATGTGFAPFASLVRDPEIYERFEEIIAVVGCRYVDELSFATRVIVSAREHELVGELADRQLTYFATVTREPFHHQGRIPDLITSGKLFSDLGAAGLDKSADRAMICGNPSMLLDVKRILTDAGFTEGSSGTPGEYVVEKAFAER